MVHVVDNEIKSDALSKPAEPQKSESVKTRREHGSLKIGTDENPIVLVPESAPRVKLIKHLYLDCFKSRDIDFKKNNAGIDLNKWGSSERDYYISNVIRNKFLNHVETKLALHLYNLFCGDNGIYFPGYVFVVRDTPQYKTLIRRYGYGLTICNYHKTENIYHGLESFRDLYDDLGFLFEKYCASDLASALQTLHDFAYITVTDIVEENLNSNRYLSSTDIPKFESKIIKRKPRLKHIRLCRWMIHTPVWSKLLAEAPVKAEQAKKEVKSDQAADIAKS